jgi:hypothetical protein
MSENQAKLVEETSSLKVQIELLKKELADLGVKSKAKDKEKHKEQKNMKEKEKEKEEAGANIQKVLQDKNAELVAEVARVRGESTSSAEENIKLKREYGQVLADNEKLLADNAELVNQLQKLYDDLQNRPAQPRDIDDLDLSNGGFSPKTKKKEKNKIKLTLRIQISADLVMQVEEFLLKQAMSCRRASAGGMYGSFLTQSLVILMNTLGRRE